MRNSDFGLTNFLTRSNCYYFDIADTGTDIEKKVLQETMFSFFIVFFMQCHIKMNKNFPDMKDNNKVKQIKAKIKTIDQNTSELGSFNYKIKLSIELSWTQSLYTDVFATFCTFQVENLTIYIKMLVIFKSM